MQPSSTRSGERRWGKRSARPSKESPILNSMTRATIVQVDVARSGCQDVREPPAFHDLSGRLGRDHGVSAAAWAVSDRQSTSRSRSRPSIFTQPPWGRSSSACSTTTWPSSRTARPSCICFANPTARAPAPNNARSFGRHWTPVHVDFVVDDIDYAVARASAAGAKRESERIDWRGSKCVTFSDPFGHGFCLIEFAGGSYRMTHDG